MRLRLLAPLLAALAAACAPQPEVWLTPNLGSPDMLDMFAHPQQWASARARVDVFKFYSQHILLTPEQCPLCGPNTLSRFAALDAFAKLRAWRIRLSVEVSVLKPGLCSADLSAPRAEEAVDRIVRLGGLASSLSMDEPLASAAACGDDLASAAAETARLVRRLRETRSEVAIGDIEPYPLFDVDTLRAWLDELTAQGATPAFFHLDVDQVDVARRQLDVGEALQSVQRLCRERMIPFGVLFYGRDRVDDAEYYAAVTDWAGQVAAAVGTPDHAVFQSFSMSASGSFEVPRNLPDWDHRQFSHTRLLNEGLTILSRPRRTIVVKQGSP